ncbi:MAG TPA: LysR family transcriptional regulator [Stellaceae bacterium]
MDLKHLEHFVAVAEEQHFTRAARRLNIVQSGLSASIRALEAELRVDLFRRSTRRVEMTSAGRVLLDEARRVLAAARVAREAVAAVQGLQRGTLSIGTVQSLAPFLDLPALIGRFHAAHPGVEIHLRQGGSAALFDRIRDRSIDLAFVPLFGPPPQDVVATMLACEALVVACAPTHPLAGRRDVPLDRIAGETFIDFQADWGTRRLVDRTFAEAGIERRTAFEVNDIAALLDLASLGLGIALAPEALVTARNSDDRRAPVACAELLPPEICWELAVVHASHDRDGGPPANAAAAAFLDMIPLPDPPLVSVYA